MKSELGIRPLYHQLRHRVEAHILVAFLAYYLFITLRNRLQVLAPGLTPKAVLERLATIQLLDVWFPTTDGRWLVMPRFTQPATGGRSGHSAAQTQAGVAVAAAATDQSPRPRIPAKSPQPCSADLFDRLIEN
jgi:hypothetical protein